MILKPGIHDLFKSSFRSILKNKSRTILTSLGIIIGVTSVILLTSIGNGIKNYINQQFESLGANTVYIYPGQIFNDNGGFGNSGGMMTTSFTTKDVTKLKSQFKNLDIMPMNAVYADIKSNRITKKSVEIAGSTYDYGKNNNLVPSEGNGRWFTKEESEKKSPVIVLGNKIATTLFPAGNAIGKKVIVKGKELKVIGILDSKGGGMGGQGIDSNCFVPLELAFDLAGSENINAISVKVPNKDMIESTKKSLTKFMLDRYDEDAFSVFDSSQLISSINSIISVLTIGLTGIAAISLVVGGIGIMNIMLVSVTERTKEIGLRKAIGASPEAILVQFLIEAIILSYIGGLTGITLGFLGTLAINTVFPAKITLSSIILAFGVSTLVGIIFGVAPARKASKLSPIEALRYE